MSESPGVEACAADPWTFACLAVKTHDPQADRPIRRFPEYEFLHRFFDACRSHKLLCVEKSRQMLLTWGAVIFCLWSCLFHKYRHWIIQSEKEEKAKALIRPRADVVLKYLPSELKVCEWVIKANRVEFSNGSILQAVPQGPQQIASYSPTGVILDEMGLQEHAKASYQTLLPALRSGGQLIGISTPRGENFFHSFGHEIPAVHRESIHYSEHPVYAAEAKKMGGWANWRKARMKQWGYNYEMWQREMEIDYGMISGKPAFRPPFTRDTHVASRMMEPAISTPIQRGWDFGFHRPACVWTQVAHNKQWLILREFLGKDMMLADFVREVVRRSKTLAPWARPHNYEDFCDPSGVNIKDSGKSSVQVLNEFGIYPMNIGETAPKVPVMQSVRIVRRNLALMRVGGETRPGTLLDPSCELIIKGLDGAYGVSEKDVEATGAQRVTFFGGKTAHLIDALRYVAAGKFDLGVPQWMMRKSA